jgi:hypothetical protein
MTHWHAPTRTRNPGEAHTLGEGAGRDVLGLGREGHSAARCNLGCPGTLYITFTRREPQRGHFSRDSNWSSGNPSPLVHTSVFISSSELVLHSIVRRLLRLWGLSVPHRHRAVRRQPSFHASPRVVTDMGTKQVRFGAMSQLGSGDMLFMSVANWLILS